MDHRSSSFEDDDDKNENDGVMDDDEEDGDLRDAGVSDSDWSALKEAKRLEQRDHEERVRIRRDLERLARLEAEA